jgi:hypothetical protein
LRRQGELGLGVDGDEVRLGGGGLGHVSRPARAKLEHARGVRVAQEREEQLGVAGAVERVVEPERLRDGEGGQVLLERVAHEPDLPVQVQAQPGQVHAAAPRRVARVGHVGERRVDPLRDDVEALAGSDRSGGAGGEGAQAVA